MRSHVTDARRECRHVARDGKSLVMLRPVEEHRQLVMVVKGGSSA
ncbi:MAG TPA: hypothetical protein VFK36_08030 [Gemmatimonadales bacterium]|nr:hypothetical protein [Gemmatimonadales bacterium]